MSTLVRPARLAPLAAPFHALASSLHYLHESWILSQAMIEDARKKYPHLQF